MVSYCIKSASKSSPKFNFKTVAVKTSERKKKRNENKKQNKTKQNRVEFDYLERAVNDRLLTGAIPQLFEAEAFACCVSTLDRFGPL